MMKKLCRSHLTVLRKVATQLAYKQTMQYTQLILSVENRSLIEVAEKKVYEAINILEQIK